MFSRTKAMALALMAAASTAFRGPGIVPALKAQHPGTARRGQDRNPQGIDLFYLSKSYRSNSKYQPHSGKRQQERFAKNYKSDSFGNIHPLTRRDRKVMKNGWTPAT